MKWGKKGVIFVPGSGDPNMASHAAMTFAESIDRGTTRVYFSSRNSKGQSLPFNIDLKSNNLSEIVFLNSKPLFDLGDLGTFDDNGIMPCCIVNHDGRKFLYYVGWNPQVLVSYRISIGLAISDDFGKSFKKYSKGPILDRCINEPYFMTAPYVIIDDNKWKMWYVSCTEWRIINNHPEPKYHIKYVESNNGVDWSPQGIVCIDYDESTEAIARPCIIKENNLFKMWYSYRKILNYRSSRDCSYRIGYAESQDGINWNRNDQFVGIEKSEVGWDSEMIEYCHVVRINKKLHMFYNGNGFGKTGFGYAVLDE